MKPSPHPPALGADWRAIAQALAISDELGVYTELEDILRRAVELARDRLRLERVSIYLRDEKTGSMRGSFGTGPSGETLDERWHAHSVSREDCEALQRLVPQGRLWSYFDDVEWQVPRPRRTLIMGRGWNAVTPLLAAGRVVGVMYSDAALSGSSFDADRQVCASVLCSSLANIILAKQPGLTRKRGDDLPKHTRTVRRVLAALEQDAGVRGQDLARELRVSPGHLARMFKNELGVSLVEYRNRLRLQSFFDRLERGETNLERTANAAGFGSYAQFHRVYRRMFGGTPRDLVSRTVAAK